MLFSCQKYRFFCTLDKRIAFFFCFFFFTKRKLVPFIFFFNSSNEEELVELLEIVPRKHCSDYYVRTAFDNSLKYGIHVNNSNGILIPYLWRYIPRFEYQNLQQVNRVNVTGSSVQRITVLMEIAYRYLN